MKKFFNLINTVKMKKYLYIIISLFLVISCEQVQLETFGEQKYVQFVDAYKDSTTLTFVFFPNQTTINYPLEVKLLGRMEDKDINYKLKVVSEGTTAPANMYSIPENQVLHKGNITGLAQIQFIKSPELDIEAYRIEVEIIDSEDAFAGETIHTRKIFWISNLIAQPEWWDATIIKSFMGAYSDLKYIEFIKVSGTGDLTDKTPGEIRSLCLKFKYYLQQREDAGDPVKEADGANMTVPVLG